MSVHNSGSFGAVLVEDMILTLANLRASLNWLSGTTGGGDGRHRAGWDRFDRQLEMLEARARDLLDGVKSRAETGAVESAAPPAPVRPRRVAFPDNDDDIDNIFLPGTEVESAVAVFQSRRHGA